MNLAWKSGLVQSSMRQLADVEVEWGAAASGGESGIVAVLVITPCGIVRLV